MLGYIFLILFAKISHLLSRLTPCKDSRVWYIIHFGNLSQRIISIKDLFANALLKRLRVQFSHKKPSLVPCKLKFCSLP